MVAFKLINYSQVILITNYSKLLTLGYPTKFMICKNMTDVGLLYQF
jgi:hypothetical protein